MKEILLKSLCVEKERVQYLDHVSFTLGHGSFLCVYGATGSGKSVLLETIFGMHTPSDGVMDFVNGEGEDEKTTMGYAPEEPQYYPKATVRSLIRLAARKKGAQASVPDILSWLDDVDIDAASSVRMLSESKKKMVGIAMAVIGHPTILLMDEPFRGVTNAYKKKILELIKTEVAGGATIIIACSDARDVPSIATHIMKLDGGRVAFFNEMPPLKQKNKAEDEKEATSEYIPEQPTLEVTQDDIDNENISTLSGESPYSISDDGEDAPLTYEYGVGGAADYTIINNDVNNATELSYVTQGMHELDNVYNRLPDYIPKKRVTVICKYMEPAMFSRLNPQDVVWGDEGVSFTYQGDINILVISLMRCNIQDIYITDIK
ncbi:MAG: ATP-binding cassette domain-containing protein [Clostridiales bacterium]|nr:ATP-binding cassette domain-containing protein [Clostridiales bacterium]